MAEANKAEKLGFVRLYNATVPIANVFVQDPNKLPRLGEIEHNTHMMFVAHYCWEAGLLLVSSHVVDAPMGWLEDEDLRPRMTSHHCGTETSAVDRIVRMKREEWSKRCADVELAVYQHKPLRVTRYDADGVIQEDPKPAPGAVDVAPNISEDNDSASGYGDDLIDETAPEERGDVDGATGEELDAAESKFEDSRPLVYGKATGQTRADAVAARKAESKATARHNPLDQSMVTISVDGQRPVSMTDKQFRDLPGKIRKLANGRQASAAKGGR